MAVNDLANRSFLGITAQVEVFSCISMVNVAAASDINYNGVLHVSLINKEKKDSVTHEL